MVEVVINLTLENDFLEKVDMVATNESRTREELIHSSLKMYINQRQRLQELYSYGESVASKNVFSEDDILNEVNNYRNTN